MNPRRRNLRKLLRMRALLIACMLVFLIFTLFHPTLHLLLTPAAISLFAYGAISIATILKLHVQQEISEQLWFTQLLGDILFLTIFLYCAGGYTNPFISLYLVPLMIASTTLPRHHTWVIGLLLICCYTLLIFFYHPLITPHEMLSQRNLSIQLHLGGMWFSFILSVMLLLLFVTDMAETVRQRDRAISRMREQAVRDEHLLALGALAAGAAHELGTPLSTMAVLTHELVQQYQHDKTISQSSAILEQEIKRCKAVLSRLSLHAGNLRAEGGQLTPLDHYINQLLASWHSQQPVTIDTILTTPGTVPKLFADLTCTQAILNLLNNAIEAKATHIEIKLSWSKQKITIEIRDNGCGISADAIKTAKQPFTSSKAEGRGLGLFLSHAVFERLGGSLQLQTTSPHGTVATIQLPRRVAQQES